MSIIEIVVSLILIVATIMVVATAIAMWRAPDALTRVNLMGPTVAIAIPLVLVSKLLYDWATIGFDLNNLIRALIAIFGVWIIAALGSYYMGRAIYGVTVSDVKYAARLHKLDDSGVIHPGQEGAGQRPGAESGSGAEAEAGAAAEAGAEAEAGAAARAGSGAGSDKVADSGVTQQEEAAAERAAATQQDNS